jgi:hypothetical protein
MQTTKMAIMRILPGNYVDKMCETWFTKYMSTTETTSTHQITKNTFGVFCTCGYAMQVTSKGNCRTGENFGTTKNHALHVAEAHRATHKSEA